MTAVRGHFNPEHVTVKERCGSVLREYINRHRTLVTASSAALVAVLVMGSVAVWQAQRAVRAELAAAESELAEQAMRDEVLAQSNFGTVLWEHFSNRAIDVHLPPEVRAELWEDVLAAFDGLREQYGRDNPVVLENFARALKEKGDSLGGGSVASVGDTQGAAEAFTEAAGIYEDLADRQPERLDLRYRGAVALYYAGNTLRDLNRSSAAADRYADAERLLKKIPENSELAPNRARAMNAVLLQQAIMLGRDCRLDESARAMRDLIELRQARVERASDPDETELAKRELSIALVVLAQVHLTGGETAEAEDTIRRALALRESILETMGPDRRRRSDVAQANYVLGQVLSAQRRFERAQERLSNAQRTFELLVQESPRAAKAREYLCRALIATAEDRLDAGEPARSASIADGALRAVDELEAEAPGEATIRGLRAEAMLAAGEAAVALGERLERAGAMLEESMRLTETLRASDPERPAHRRKLARVLIALGDLEQRLAERGEADTGDRQAEALARFVRAKRIYDELEMEGRLCGVSQTVRVALESKIDGLSDP